MTQNKYKPVTHCIFDMDGLLIGKTVEHNFVISKINDDMTKSIYQIVCKHFCYFCL